MWAYLFRAYFTAYLLARKTKVNKARFWRLFCATCRVTCFCVQKSLKRLYSMLILRFSCRFVPLLLSATFLWPFSGKTLNRPFYVVLGRLRGGEGRGHPLGHPDPQHRPFSKFFLFFRPFPKFFFRISTFPLVLDPPQIFYFFRPLIFF